MRICIEESISYVSGFGLKVDNACKYSGVIIVAHHGTDEQWRFCVYIVGAQPVASPNNDAAPLLLFWIIREGFISRKYNTLAQTLRIMDYLF